MLWGIDPPPSGHMYRSADLNEAVLVSVLVDDHLERFVPLRVQILLADLEHVAAAEAE